MANKQIIYQDGKSSDQLERSRKKGKVTRHGNDRERQITLLSVNGSLQSTRDLVDPETSRAAPYVALEIGKPVVIEYLRFSLHSDSWEGGNNELMISTYLKTKETKQAGAEAISYYDEEVRPSNGRFDLIEWGAKNYGHPLLYYTKSYKGESIDLTIQVMELDKVNTDLIKQLKKSVDSFASIPIFSAYLPYFSLAKSTIGFFESVANFFNRDDKIIPYHNVSLYNRRTAGATFLQSGRYVCIPSTTINKNDFINQYSLTKDHILINNDKVEFDKSYIVFKVNNENNPDYENFDHFLRAAELLAKTNRDGNPQALISSVVEITRGISDLNAALSIEENRFDTSSNTKKLIQAHWNGMSPSMKAIYEKRYSEIISNFGS